MNFGQKLVRYPSEITKLLDEHGLNSYFHHQWPSKFHSSIGKSCRKRGYVWMKIQNDQWQWFSMMIAGQIFLSSKKLIYGMISGQATCFQCWYIIIYIPQKYFKTKKEIMAVFDGMNVCNECCLTWDQYIVTFLTIWTILLTWQYISQSHCMKS